MGLPVSLLARGPAARSPQADQAARRVYAELHEVDEVFSLYRADSTLSRIARGELTLSDAGEQVRSVAERCRWARELTGARFDAVRPDGVWDPAGLVKGWAAERAGRGLRDVPDVDWCLNAGGDVLVSAASGEPFTVGIQDPRDAGRVAATVTCASGAVATSGTAARGAHLYDPATGRAAAGQWLSMSVAGPSLEAADVLATAAFIAGDAWTDVVHLLPGYAGLAIDAGGGLVPTAGWAALALGGPA